MDDSPALCLSFLTYKMRIIMKLGKKKKKKSWYDYLPVSEEIDSEIEMCIESSLRGNIRKAVRAASWKRG